MPKSTVSPRFGQNHRVIRSLFNFAAAVSLLACLSAIGLWVFLNTVYPYPIYMRYDRFRMLTIDGRGFQFEEWGLYQPLLVRYFWLTSIPAVFAWFFRANATITTPTPKRLKPGVCPTCSYNLTGNISGTCPECGTPVPWNSQAAARLGTPTAKFTVFVEDNFRRMAVSERYKLGEFETHQMAVAACKEVVDEFLSLHHKPGMTPAALCEAYRTFGDSPFILPVEGYQQFLAADYAERRSAEICRDAQPRE